MMRRRCFGESRREYASAARDEPKLRSSSFVLPLSYNKRIDSRDKKKREKNKENNSTRSKCLNQLIVQCFFFQEFKENF